MEEATNLAKLVEEHRPLDMTTSLQEKLNITARPVLLTVNFAVKKQLKIIPLD